MADISQETARGVLRMSVITGVGVGAVSCSWLTFIPACGVGLLSFVAMFFFCAAIVGIEDN